MRGISMATAIGFEFDEYALAECVLKYSGRVVPKVNHEFLKFMDILKRDVLYSAAVSHPLDDANTEYTVWINKDNHGRVEGIAILCEDPDPENPGQWFSDPVYIMDAYEARQILELDSYEETESYYAMFEH